MRHKLHTALVKETNRIIRMMREMYDEQLEEAAGVTTFFNSFQERLSKVYLRPNNIIDAGYYSMSKIESALSDMGFEFRKDMEGKFHYFNDETSVSVYLSPNNKRITFTP